MLCWNNTIWLVKRSHVNIFNQSDGTNSEKHSFWWHRLLGHFWQVVMLNFKLLKRQKEKVSEGLIFTQWLNDYLTHWMLELPASERQVVNPIKSFYLFNQTWRSKHCESQVGRKFEVRTMPFTFFAQTEAFVSGIIAKLG